MPACGRSWVIALLAVTSTSFSAELFAADPPPPLAETKTDGDAGAAVQLAESAFEYRDFDKVVETLNPWVHPPRITNTKLMVKARSLLGVSRHVLGDVPAAREEFGQLLLADPVYKLDPFVVPPNIVATFEAVRKEMKPVLDRILSERGMRPPVEEGPTKLVLVQVPDPWVTYMPFGVPQFALDEPGTGAVFLGLQLVGVVTNVAAFVLRRNLTEPASGVEPDGAGALLVAHYAGLTTFVIGWTVSIVLASLSRDQHTQALLERAQKSANVGPKTGFGLSLDLP